MFFLPGVFVSFVLGLRFFLRNILSGIIRRLTWDGDIKDGCKGEERNRKLKAMRLSCELRIAFCLLMSYDILI